MSSHEDELIRLARQLQRELTQRRKLRRNLKTCEANIRLSRKQLAALKAHMEGRRPDAAPSRLHNGVTAVGVAHPELDDNIGNEGPYTDETYRK